MIRGCWTLLTAALLSTGIVTGADPPTHARDITVADKGYRVQFRVQPMTLPERDVETWYGGVSQGSLSSTRPLTIIGAVAFNVAHGSHRLFVPVSAWSGLAQIRQISIHVAKVSRWIQMDGGDAAGSYSARIYFNSRDQVTKRVVSIDGEMREETRYVPYDTGTP